MAKSTICKVIIIHTINQLLLTRNPKEAAPCSQTCMSCLRKRSFEILDPVKTATGQQDRRLRESRIWRSLVEIMSWYRNMLKFSILKLRKLSCHRDHVSIPTRIISLFNMTFKLQIYPWIWTMLGRRKLCWTIGASNRTAVQVSTYKASRNISLTLSL